MNGKPSVQLPSMEAEPARAQLKALLTLRTFGLRHGLPFFADCSYWAAQQLAEGVPAPELLAELDETDEATVSESAAVLFRGVDPFHVDVGEIPGVCGGTFVEVAAAVFGEWFARRGSP
jgi:hypothetical protein